MSKIGDSERKTQNRVVKLFKNNLNYTYLGNLQYSDNKNILPDKLLKYLRGKGYSEKLSNSAIELLIKTSANLQHGLYDANKKVYSLLKYGAKVCEKACENEKTVFFIDFEHPADNDFYIAEEVTVIGNNEKRPDLVIYVNGIAFAFIELKRSSRSVAEGIRQNIGNQKEMFIQDFFTTIQLCMAGNDSEGLRYGTLLTPEKYYLEWKDDSFDAYEDERCETDFIIDEKCKAIEEKLDKQIFAMFYKSRFLDLIHNFLIFDKGRKKVCRYNQYYAIKRAQKRICDKKRGGIVWHTQGSGKSLTMVWLSKWIFANNSNARVLIVTDREELDDQIEKNYIGVDEKNIVRTKSGKDLIEKLNSHENRLICSLVHKFGGKSSEISDLDYDKYVEELMKSLPKDFSVKGEVYVFVDECHRTQSGKLHKAMKTIMPNSIFIGFTGTPLLKADKATSLEVFGGYIHTYKFTEGVKDKVILDLRYEARDVPQNITSQERIDEWFDIKTQGLTKRAKAKLKAKWGTMQNVFSSRTRLESIARDIIFDFETKSRLSNGTGNAILIAESVYSACKYYEIFQNKNFKKCAIISSFEPNASVLRTEITNDEESTETFEKYETYKKMLNGKSTEDFETEAKTKFIEQPANMKLLIVVNKLLTGFDAPPCTYLYIDKKMRDHGLFQAICRVNRLDDETKDFGYIVDYSQLFGSLTDAMATYTSGAFENFDAEDVDGLIKDRTSEAKSFFEDTLDELDELCDGVEMPREKTEYQHYFCGKDGYNAELEEEYARIREKLYSLINRLIRAYADVKACMTDIGYTSIQANKFDKRVAFYVELKDTVGRASGDFIDLKVYEPGMRYLIDNYINADEAIKIANLDEFTLLDFVTSREEDILIDDKGKNESAAEAIENNIRRKIVEKQPINPKYYDKMSAVLEQIILERKQGTLAFKSLIDRYKEVSRNVVTSEENSEYPENIRHSGAMRAFYDNLGEDEALAIKLHEAVLRSKLDGFRETAAKQQKIKREINKILPNKEDVERIFKIVMEQKEY